MRKIRFKYPPCIQNPMTEEPYPSHDWEIVQDKLLKKTVGEESVFYYKVICKRCKINHPNPPLH